MQALSDAVCAHAALLGRQCVVCFDACTAGGERGWCDIGQHRRQAGVEARDSDSAAHRAGSDDSDALDGARRQALRQSGHATGVAIGEERVAECS